MATGRVAALQDPHKCMINAEGWGMSARSAGGVTSAVHRIKVP
jgi:hypothetical protein